VRFPFRALPLDGGGSIARPVVPVWVEGIEATAFDGLVDSGALGVRFDRSIADVAGIDLSHGDTANFAVGGTLVAAVEATVGLRVEGDSDAYAWEAAVWFCNPWPFGFQLLGLNGFLQQFRITISAYQEWTELFPEST
jgi:hypothetical protein